MGNTAEWMSLAKMPYSLKNTPQTYFEISRLGLKTINWEDYQSEDPFELIDKSKRFILESSPCLFIWDPLFFDENLKKGFLFGQTNSLEIEKWVIKNKNNLSDYRFLITSQITNPDDGFVGTVYSDGLGKILCETLHHPGICNHQKLSQSGIPNLENIDYFTYEESLNYSRPSFAGKVSHMDYYLTERIIETYKFHKGYFEFVFGENKGMRDIYTIGFESDGLFKFPHNWHRDLFLDSREI